MHFKSRTPAAPLDQHVQSIFHYKHFMPEHSIERMLPDGRTYLIFELDGIERTLYDRLTLKPIQTYIRVWLAGMQKHYISISAHRNSEMFVVQFKPGGLSAFLQQPLSDFDNQVVSAESVFGESVIRLHAALKSSNGNETKMFALAESFLNSIGKFEQTAGHVLVSNIIAAIEANAALQLQDVVANAGYSQKQAIQLFKKYVGLNPKTFQRIVRFNEILPLVMEKKSVSWQHICAECFYYDQSHFIREFKAFSGYNPREFLTEQGSHPETNFFPLN